jgi:hypothetical protein
MTSTTGLDTKYVRIPILGLNSLVLILVDNTDVREHRQGGYGSLFEGLAGEKASCVLVTDATNGEGRDSI